jgi:mercuric ion binding protein
MKSMKTLLAGVVAALILTAPAWASPQIVTLNVPGMTCPACPITIKKALEKVQGVSKVDVRYEKKQVLVTFDDAKNQYGCTRESNNERGFSFATREGRQVRVL